VQCHQRLHETAGEPGQRFRTGWIGSTAVSEATFDGNLALPAHAHDTPVLAVFLAGAMGIEFACRQHDCGPCTVQVHPAGEPHAQYYGPAGARMLVVQPVFERQDTPRALSRLIDRISNVRHAGIADLAQRAVLELRCPDQLSPLALEALVLEILVAAARLTPQPARPDALPAWLERAAELVHDRFREHLQLGEIADQVGVHPGHLARSFRRHYRLPLGTYIRRLRLGWAARRLGESDEPIASIALSAGFADQSHFTRVFRRYAGATPAQARQNRR
jgi:AraC family transcriptional regulator